MKLASILALAAFALVSPASAQPFDWFADAKAPPAERGEAPAKFRSVDPAFLPSVVRYATKEAAGTIVIDTNARYLYLVLGDGEARR